MFELFVTYALGALVGGTIIGLWIARGFRPQRAYKAAR
jgi:hypothetical protein